jgi:PAS domain S-box-containing protein
MDRIGDTVLGRYVALLSRFSCTEDELDRELALIDATELAKSLLHDGPAIDQMHELHARAQRALAERWYGAAPGTPEDLARERLVRGDALPLMLALVLPHELAQRAHHEQRWRREHETLVAMFEQTDDMIVVLDADGQCDDVNPAFARQTGWTRREAVEGAAAWPTPPEARSNQRCRTEQRRRDGSHFTVEWSVSSVYGRKGELLTFVCIGRDVDRQQKIDDSLRENDKLRAVATLAGGIAHDFNNLLGSVLGLAELCELEAVPGSRQARNLGRIREAGGKAAALVRQMLDFSRQTTPTLQPAVVDDWLAHTAALLRAALPHHQTLSLGTQAPGAVVCIDTVQMEQVLLNMLRNASQAMGARGGAVSILSDLAGPTRMAAADGRTGHLRLRIVDEGDGIPPDVLDKIFEPFFTTKPVGEGTGLGLAAVHGIITGHGGQIEVSSQPGMGTTFSLFLPLAPAPVPA